MYPGVWANVDPGGESPMYRWAASLLILLLVPSAPDGRDTSAIVIVEAQRATTRPSGWNCGCAVRGVPLTYLMTLRLDSQSTRDVLAELAWRYGVRTRVIKSADSVIVDILPERHAEVRADPHVVGLAEMGRDRYLVTLSPNVAGTTSTEQIANDLARQYNIRVALVFSSGEHFVAIIPPEQYAAVRADPRVRGLAEDIVFSIDGSPRPSLCPTADPTVTALVTRSAQAQPRPPLNRGSWSTHVLSRPRVQVTGVTAGTKAVFVGNGYEDPSLEPVVDIYDDATGEWSTALLSEARGRFAVGAVGTKVLFAGGWLGAGGQNGVTATVDIYDSTTGAWTVEALSQARREATPVRVGTKLMFAGGIGRDGVSNAVDVFDVSTGEWSTAQLSQRERFVGAVAVGGKALFSTSANRDSLNPAVVDIYDSITDQWTSAQLSTEAMHNDLTTASVGDKAVFVRGIPYQCGGARVVDIYDSATNRWSSTILGNRISMSVSAATTVGDKLMIPSRAIGDRDISVVDVYESKSDRWSTVSLSDGHFPDVAASIGPLAMFAGGFDYQFRELAIVDVYDNATDSWSVVRLSQARRVGSATVVGQKLIFAGGTVDREYVPIVDIFDSQGR